MKGSWLSAGERPGRKGDLGNGDLTLRSTPSNGHLETLPLNPPTQLAHCSLHALSSSTADRNLARHLPVRAGAMVSDSPNKRPRGEGRPSSRDQADSSLPPDHHHPASPPQPHSSHPHEHPHPQQGHPPALHPTMSPSGVAGGGSRKPSKRKSGSSAPAASSSRSRVNELQKTTQPTRSPAPQPEGPVEDGIWVGQLERDKMGFSR